MVASLSARVMAGESPQAPPSCAVMRPYRNLTASPRTRTDQARRATSGGRLRAGPPGQPHRPLPAPDDLHCPGEASVSPPLVFCPQPVIGKPGSEVSETWACFDSPPEVSAARAQPALSGPFVGDDRRRTGYKQEQDKKQERAGSTPLSLSPSPLVRLGAQNEQKCAEVTSP